MFVLCKRFSLRKNGYLTLFYKDKKFRNEKSTSWWTIDIEKAYIFTRETDAKSYLFLYSIPKYSKVHNKFYLSREVVEYKVQENKETLKKMKEGKFFNKILTKYN